MQVKGLSADERVGLDPHHPDRLVPPPLFATGLVRLAYVLRSLPAAAPWPPGAEAVLRAATVRARGMRVPSSASIPVCVLS